MIYLLYLIVWGLTLVVAVGIAAPIACDCLGHRYRKRRLSARTALTADEWFGGPEGSACPSYEPLEHFLTLLADRLGITWGQLRKEDRLTTTLNYDPPFTRFAKDDYEDLDWIIEEWGQRYGVDPSQVAPSDDSLEAYVDALRAAHRAQSGEPGASPTSVRVGGF